MKIKTDQATIDALKDAMKEMGGENKKIRVLMVGMGWGGPRYGIALDELKDTDYLDDSNDVHFIMDKDEYDQMGDMEVIKAGDGFSVMKAGAAAGCC